MDNGTNHSIISKLIKNPIAVVSLIIIFLAGIISIFCYPLSTDHTKNAALQNLVLKYESPGFEQQMLKIPYDNYSVGWSLDDIFFGKTIDFDEVAIADIQIDSNKNKLLYKPYLKDGLKADWVSLDLEPWVAHKISPEEIKEDFIYNKTFWLGTDSFGRDFLSRLLVGTRISFFVGFVAVAISLLVGIFVGAMGGYYRGRVDQIIMWLINVVWSIPTLLLVIAITLAIGKGFWQIFIAVGLTMWVEVARIVRGQFLSYREKEFVEAARALGYNDYRIIFKHILPNITGPIIVISAANFAAAILIESGLSFLGIGAQPPTPSWGNIIKEHYSHLIIGKEHLALLPGLFILLLVLSFNLLGNALRDATDVKAIDS